MAKEHFNFDATKAEASMDDFWKNLQIHWGVSDEELEMAKADPKRSKFAPMMDSPKMRHSTMIIEVVESYGCSEGMEVGDKLYFTGVAKLDPTRSSPWCAHALDSCSRHAHVSQDLILHGVDPNDRYWDHFSCGDCGCKFSWGNIKMKAYVIEE
jgi:uncharacterized repeat protein (TIGR04076 family)